jgi:hypothetical protein
MNALVPKAFETGWHFLDGSQEFALSAPANHILYHGTRGPGKTDTQLMRFRSRCNLGYGAFWRGIIFDKEYKNLDDLVQKSKRWFYDYNDGAVFLESTSQFKWKWPSGEELLFRSVRRPEDYWAYHGHEYPFIGWNELTKYETPKLYEKMMSTNRSSFRPIDDTPRLRDIDNCQHIEGVDLEHKLKWMRHWYPHSEWGPDSYATPDGQPLPEIPLECFSTCNPYGAGHAWVKRRFIEPVPDCTPIITKTLVYNPRTKKEQEIEKVQIAIHGSYKENTFLSPEYIAELHALTDENEREAWLNGNWDINAGGAFADVWRKQIHVVDRFPIPENWHIDRAFDWGSSHPFSVGWFAESNGEEVTFEDAQGVEKTVCYPKGTLIQFFEWYGTKEIGTNVGLKLSAKKIAEGIRDREIAMMAGGWIRKQPSAGPADNQISNVMEADTETIEKKMADVGIRWTKSDKAKGSRKNGLQLMRDRLEASMTGEGAGLLFMSNCVASIAIIPMLPRDEKDLDDVDTTSEDHCYDMARYRCLAGNDRTATIIHLAFVN